MIKSFNEWILSESLEDPSIEDLAPNAHAALADVKSAIVKLGIIAQDAEDDKLKSMVKALVERLVSVEDELGKLKAWLAKEPQRHAPTVSKLLKALEAVDDKYGKLFSIFRRDPEKPMFWHVERGHAREAIREIKGCSKSECPVLKARDAFDRFKAEIEDTDDENLQSAVTTVFDSLERMLKGLVELREMPDNVDDVNAAAAAWKKIEIGHEKMKQARGVLQGYAVKKAEEPR